MVMSSLVEPGAKGESTYIQTNDITRKHQNRHILKAKENALKYKCSRALRRKLKKYKLRHDGKEDQDVLDVSKTLITLLKIKSPNNRNQEDNCQSTNYSSDENLPRNYLFKMGRRKQNIKTNDSVDSNTTFANSSYDKDGNVSPVCDYKEKQHTNAFKLMMDSRNKSIGSNSPGKEKNETQMIQNETEAQDIFEKKTIKAKRNLVLQKMAEAKGSVKKKELEEYQEKCIKKKMEERAKRLKSMIKNNEIKLSKKEIDTDHVQSCLTSSSDVVELSHNKNNSKKQQKSLTLVNLFSESTKLKNNKSPEKNHISKEDNEFLKKLSPSLKKKENMLCYFKKIEKEPTPLIDIENENVEVNDDIVIKVKLSSRSKKKGKKKKLSLNKTDDNDKPKHCTELERTDAVTMAVITKETDLLKIKSDRRKRKRNDNTTQCTASNKNGDIVMDSPSMEYMRPKRNVKKPVKYVDNLALSSSDEELHIFTPKKKKNSENKQNSKHITNAKEDKSLFRNKQHSKDTIFTNNGKENKCLLNTIKNSKESSGIPGPAMSKDCKIKKKNTKLAPIFAVKSQVDPAVIEAKQKFLHSGVPDKLKKVITEQKNISMQLSIFPVVVHVQQKITTEVSTVILNKLHFGENELCDNLYVNNEVNVFKKLLDMHKDKNYKHLFDRKHKVDSHVVLKNIKHIYPKFPVFRTYRSLKDRNSGNFKDYSYTDLDNSIDVISGMVDINNQNPDKLNWTDKYKPMSTKQIVGNFEAIKELKKWLVTWTENEANSKKKGDTDSDLSDFYHSDTDSKDSIKPCNNLLIIKGPVGSGKTSSVYAVAAELAIKVIEVNVSGKRTGKIMLQDLQEATQSHKVNRGKSSTENSQKSHDVTEDSMNKVKKKGRPKKKHVDVSSKNTMSIKDECLSQPSSSQESTRTGMSLILIDDADIVFEQDDGFISAIVQLVQCSKRPVVLITSLKSCPHLQRFLLNAKKIIMQPLLPRILGTWLDIMCLADSNICLPGIGAKFLDYFHGDIRKTMNSLQFYISSQISQSVNDKGSSDNYEYFVDIDDENSSMSWADHEVPEIKCTSILNLEDKDNMKQFFYHLSKILQFGHPLDLYKIWWTIPRFLNISSKHGTSESQKNDGNSQKSSMGISEMEMIAKVIDAVSVSDYYSHIKPDTLMNITSQPWYSVEYDSVSEQENLCNYNRNYDSIDEVSHELVFGCIIEAQKAMGLENNVDVHFPSMIEQRERDKIVNNHNNLTSYLNPSAVLDRRALALDFWPSCRSICRIEKTKTDNNSKKRNNRFCHYLKSLNVMCKMNSFDMLADSLHPKSNY